MAVTQMRQTFTFIKVLKTNKFIYSFINKVEVHFLIVKNAYLLHKPHHTPSHHITHTTQQIRPNGSKESK